MVTSFLSSFSFLSMRNHLLRLPRRYIAVSRENVGTDVYKMTSDTILGINNAEIYHKYHEMQASYIRMILKRYLPKLRLNKVSKMLDIGCGPGDITHKYLLPLVPENGALLGIDMSSNMIQYASSLYKEPKLSFEVMDITCPLTGEKYENTFESIFSFFCLHWTYEQKSVMENIHKILKPEGECLLVFVATWPFYNMYEILARNRQWFPYVKEYKMFISPYHQLADPAGDVQNLMEEVGLQIKDCVCSPRTYVMPSEEIFYKTLLAVDPFISNIPDHLLQDYFEDCKTIIWKENYCRLEPTNEVTIDYSIITVHAYKL